MTGVRGITRTAGTLAAGAVAASTILACVGPPTQARPTGTGRPTGTVRPASTAAAAPNAAPSGALLAGVSAVTEVSRGCAGQNAEVVEAAAAPRLVYVAWIGCGGIGFARSTDGGRHFSPPVRVPGSAGASWDPAIAVSASGTLYLAYMHQAHSLMHPVVAASFNHGVTFPQVVPLTPKVKGNWGDRDFIAVGRHGKVYVSWDYGPSAAKVQFICSPVGSCAFSAGDVNAVVQQSADGGKTWGPITPAGPRFPRNGGISNPLLVRPSGRVDMLSWGHFVGRAPGYKLFPGHEFFSSSANGTTWPQHPRKLGAAQGSIALPVWWIDGDLAADQAGTLYATWDTQAPQGDIGWLSWSVDGGGSWSAPVRATPGGSRDPHIMQVAGGGRGIAYVAWQTDASAPGYATYLRPYSIARGWLGKAVRVSPQFGNPRIWPGDTFGIAPLPGTGAVSLSWGSAVGASSKSEIWAAVVTLPQP